MADAKDTGWGIGLGEEVANPPAVSTFLLDNQTKKVAWTFQGEYNIALDTAVFSVTAFNGAPQYLVSLQALDSSGNPTGTPLGGGSPVSASFVPSSVKVESVAFDNSYTPTASEMLALVIEDDSTGQNPDASNDVTIGYRIVNFVGHGGPPDSHSNSGSWSASPSHSPAFGVRSGTRAFGVPLFSLSSPAINGLGNRFAIRFKKPPTSGSGTFQIAGIRFACRVTVGSGSFKFGLWEGISITHQIVTLDTIDFASQNNWDNRRLMFDASSLVTLNVDTEYFIGIEHNGTQILYNSMVVDTPDDLSALPGGTDVYVATWAGSSWTHETTRRISAELIIRDVTEPAGNGDISILTEQPVMYNSLKIVSY